MIDVLEILGVLLLTLNAPATLHLWRRTTSRAPGRDAAIAGGVGTLVVGGILLLCAALGQPILDLLGVSLPTFQVATGFLLILGTLPAFVPSSEGWDRSNGHLIWPVVRLVIALGSPAAVAAAIMYSADYGAGATVIGVLIAIVVSGAVVAGGRAMRTLPEAILVWIGRAFAAALVVVAVGFIREGVERV